MIHSQVPLAVWGSAAQHSEQLQNYPGETGYLAPANLYVNNAGPRYNEVIRYMEESLIQQGLNFTPLSILLTQYNVAENEAWLLNLNGSIKTLYGYTFICRANW